MSNSARTIIGVNTMKKSIIYIFLSIITLLNMSSVYAGMSEVKWINVETYKDIKASHEHQKRFEARIFSAFEKHFLKLSEKLPEGHLLKVEVTNVDLAGDIRFAAMDDIRVVKDIYPPRIAFSYKVVSKDKSVLQSGDVKLKDIGFLMGSTMRYRNKTIGYEKRMLDEWFKTTFENNT